MLAVMVRAVLSQIRQHEWLQGISHPPRENQYPGHVRFLSAGLREVIIALQKSVAEIA